MDKTKSHRVIAVSTIAAAFFVVSIGEATQPYSYIPSDATFTPVEVTIGPTPTHPQPVAIAAYPELFDLHVPATPTPTVTPKPRPKPKPKPQPVLPVFSSGSHLWGHATWYCLAGVSSCMKAHPGGLYAAAGPLLRRALGGGNNWRGKFVTVWYGKAHVTVRLADWCACGSGHTIDLYSDAIRILTPNYRSLGVIPVRITW